MGVRVLLVLAALSMVLVACGGDAQEGASKPETKPEPKTKAEPTTTNPLEYGDAVEIIGIPWSGPQQIDYEGRRVVVVIFQYAEGPGAEEGDRFVGMASGYGGQAAKELRSAGVAGRQAEPPNYRLQGTYEGWVTIDNDLEYEALMVESAEPVGSQG